MSKMSFQQKRKHRSVLPSTGSIDDEIILDSQKPKTNKSLLDFKSPKLSRLKNFIKSPVQKSYNKYKQFQDNDEDNYFIEGKVDSSLSNKQSIDDTNADIMGAIPCETQARSQTSLLTTISSVPTDSTTTSPLFDNQQSIQGSTCKQTPVKTLASTLTNHSKSAKSSNTSGNMSVSGHFCVKETTRPTTDSIPYQSIVKSASVSGLVQFQAFDDPGCQDGIIGSDAVDGPTSNVVISSGDGKNSITKWNPTIVDIDMTKVMLETLDSYIKAKQEKITKEVSQKDEMVDTLISNFTLKSDNKSSKKIRREYEAMNKSAEKSLEKTRQELEQLEYKRLLVSQEGIPWGVEPADYVKNISKKDRKKKSINPPLKEVTGPISKFLKTTLPKSASAENVSQLANIKSNEISPNKLWNPKLDSTKKHRESDQKYLTSDDHQNILPPSTFDTNTLSKLSGQSNQKPNSIGNSSAMSWDLHNTERDLQMRKSQSNSVSSGIGRDHNNQEGVNLQHESLRNQSLSVASVDDTPKSDELSFSRLLSLQDEMSQMKKDIHDVRSECNRFQFETDNLRLDMNTNSELNSQKMQNAIERVDRLERILDILRQQCQIEFCTWKDEFRNLEEKLDYRLTTTRRDLQDNIDTCNNSISLVEKRTEQLPFMANRSGRSDVKIITDHLCNLIVSLIAFIMLLISSGFHLLIRFLNIGATITQNRNTLLIPLIIVGILVTIVIKLSLLTSLETWLLDADIPHL